MALAETYFMSAVESDSSLLFGMLALQNGLVDQPDLIAAFQYWCKDRSRAMAQFLVERGALSEADRAMIDGLIRRLAQIQANAVEERAGTAAAVRDLAAGPAGTPHSDHERDELLASLLPHGDADPLALSELTIGVGAPRGAVALSVRAIHWAKRRRKRAASNC